jgi:hypothetical protein
MNNYDKIKYFSDAKLVDGYKIKSSHDILDDKKFGVGLTLIGFNSDGEILAVTEWDWKVVKITNNGCIETIGEIDYHLHAIMHNPDILLKDVKVLSMREIEEKLGYKVIVSEHMN